MPARTVDAKRVADLMAELLLLYEVHLIGGEVPFDWKQRREKAWAEASEIVHDLGSDQSLVIPGSQPRQVSPPEPVQTTAVSELPDKPACVRCNHAWGIHGDAGDVEKVGCLYRAANGDQCKCPGHQPPLVEIPAADFYDCCEATEALCHDDPVEAISEWVEQNANQGESVADVFTRNGMTGLEVVCYTHLVVTPDWVGLHASRTIDRLAEAFDEDFGHPEGEDYKTSSAVRRQFEAAVEALTKEWHIWGCDDAARVVVPVAQVVDMLWSPADPPEAKP